MVQPNAPGEIYRLHILLLQIDPPIWRRLHVPSDSTIAMLHDLLQIAFDWSDFHLHRFVIRGKEYGVSRMGCTTFTTDGDREKPGAKRIATPDLRSCDDRGAQLLLQDRTRVLNEEWRSTLSRWYPGMQETCDAKAA